MQLHPPDAEARLGFDAIRARLDGHARTVYGRERLAALAPSSVVGEVEARLARAGEMQATLGFDDPLPLGDVADLRPTLRRIAPEDSFVPGEELAAARAALALLRRLHEYFRSRSAKYPALWAVARQIAPVPELEAHLGRVVDEVGRVRDDASPELQRLGRALAEREGRLREALLRALRDAIAQGWATEDQPTVRGGRAVIPIRAEARRKVPGFVHDVSATGQTVYVEPAAALDLNNDIRELEAERRREVERVLRGASAHLRAHRVDVGASLDALAGLDAAAAAGRLALELDALVPEVGEGGPLRLVRARNGALALHVRAEAAARRAAGQTNVEPRPVVPLDLVLGEGYSTLVITGPNAGGKSVALKTAGLCALMAACGLPIPAAPGTRVPLFTRLFVDLGDRQSIADDLSTFTSHLVGIRRMLEDADDRSLVLMDEAGTGTDPAEGAALAQAVLERLTARGAIVVATTHSGALKAFAHQADGVENASMIFDRASLAPTYRFQQGVPGSSYAFEIAARVGLDAPTVARARELVGGGKTALEDLIAAFEARTREAEATLETARAEAAEAARARADYENRRDTLRQQREALRKQALDEAEAIVRDANARVEHVVREIREAEAEREVTKEARARLDALRDELSKRQQKTARRPARPNGAASTPAADGPLAVGDQVRIEGADAVGEILELTDREAVVAVGSLTTRAKRSRLVKVGGPRVQRVEVRAARAAGSSPAAERLPAIHAQTRVDVRGQRVDEAMPDVMRLVDEAVAAGVPSVEILHGKGTGVLRRAIHEHLAGRADVSHFEPAAWNLGGDGVTVVVMR